MEILQVLKSIFPGGGNVPGQASWNGGHLSAEAIDALIAKGYGYHSQIGAFSTPIQGGGAGTILDLDQPEGVLSVPQGFALIPLRFDVQAQVPLLATDSDETEIFIGVDRVASWYGDGTFTEEEVFNMRTDLGGGKGFGPIRVASAFTADMTVDGTNDPNPAYELKHAVAVGDVQGTAANALWTQLAALYEPKYPPLLVGPCSVWFYWGGTVATTGFAQLDFLAVPSAALKTIAPAL